MNPEDTTHPVDGYTDRVLDVVERIPAGRVMSYGDIADYLGEGGPRQVGRVMALWGGGVAWWRVIHADGSPPAGHEQAARAHYVAEATPLRSSGSVVRVDMRRARWLGDPPRLRAAQASLPPQREPGRPYRVCIVCMGNICRSPMAEWVLRAEIERAGVQDRVEVSSAGVGDWQLGKDIDPRARAVLARHGYHSGGHRARQIGPSWLAQYDLILAVDKQILGALHRMTVGQPDMAGRIRLLRTFDPASDDGGEVPDPYLGEWREFAHVLTLIEPAARQIATQLAQALAR